LLQRGCSTTPSHKLAPDTSSIKQLPRNSCINIRTLNQLRSARRDHTGPQTGPVVAAARQAAPDDVRRGDFG
jgi:hypothetical protein